MYKWVLIIWVLSCFPFIDAEAQNISNEGKDFWAVFPTHDPSRQGGNVALANVRIYITAKVASEVIVSCGTFSSGPIPIPINTAVPVDIPRAVAYVDQTEANGPKVNKGIHIMVTPGHEKVAVFEHIYAGARSAASLILPKEALGRAYYAMNYNQEANNNEIAKNFLVLVATDPNTTLVVHKKDGSTFKVTFTDAGEVYEYLAAAQEDLTGVYVEVDPASSDNCNKRFAAYSGSTSLVIGCGGSRDPLFQQLYPVSSWGKNYGVAPFINRRYMVRVLAQQDDTHVQFEGQSYTLNKGQFFTSSELTNGSFISADKNISVAQYSLTQACSSVNGGELLGDPEMVLLNPIEFNVKSTTLFSSDQENIIDRYINVFLKTSATSTFQINGMATNAVWTTVPSNPLYSYTQIGITDISSYLTASEGFNAVAYGFGNHESYAYSAGTNLAANTYFLVSNKITQRDAQNACVGQESDFKVVLPYLVSRITWKLDDGAEEEGPLNPRIITGADGSLSYEYIFDKNITFSELNSHRVSIKIEMVNDGTGCLNEGSEFIYPFEVYPIPTAGFIVDTDNCADTEIQFTDQSESNLPGRTLNKWIWDFGDGSPISADQHPKHIYSTAGIKTIRFSVGLDEGCMSEVKEFSINIRPKIDAAFNAPVKGCTQVELTFQDVSVSDAGPMVSWSWDFGDGTVSAEQHPKHTYQATGNYTVSLIAKTENGCQSLPVHRQIAIYSLPDVDFNLPKVCVGDDIADFINTTLNPDQSVAGLTYSWNFGDAFSAIVNNTSADQNGSHRYSRAGDYTVTLTVTNANGCSYTRAKPFTVNGSQITPVFEVLNKNKLCSNNKIAVKNSSTIDQGKIVKLVWYIDDEEKLIVDDPEPQATYMLDPTQASGASPKNITIKLVAYSGIRCQELMEETVVLNAAPVLVFDPINAVCLNSAVLQLQNAREVLGLNGQTKYSGPGIISDDGYFDPKLAGIGTHTLIFHFLSAGGCEESITQHITVNPLPQLSLPSDLYILAGGRVKTAAVASGYNLSYKWTPAVGLERDDILNPTIKIEEDKAYTLTVTSAYGCSISARMMVHLVNSIDAANAFSPNGDGVNDVWNLKYIETYPEVTVGVFNRYGEKVFFSQGYSIPFDGNYKGKQLPVGTYYYMINPKNGRKILTGSLTLIR